MTHMFTPFMSEEDHTRVCLYLDEADYQKTRPKTYEVEVTNQETGRRYVVKDADCGAGCRCAAVIVREVKASAEASYRTEFPDYDDELVLPPGFKDSSWHNDACPSMWNADQRISIFCDYKTPALREHGSSWRFSVHRTDGDGAIQWTVGESETWDGVMELVGEVPELAPEQWELVDELAAGIEDGDVKMAVVDYCGRVDHELTNVTRGETERRFGVRDMRHVAIYKLRVLQLNHKARTTA